MSKVKIKKQVQYIIEPDMPEQTKWLLQVMNFAGIQIEGLAEGLHLSRQAISSLIHCHVKMTFIQVAAICQIFHTDDDPEEIWRRISWNSTMLEEK